MNPQIELSPIQIENIRKLAGEKREALGFMGAMPAANDIFSIIENLGIYLLEYPIESEGSRPAFSAALMYSNENEKELAFLGLNTADYFDKQIFAIAHELYHYFTKTGSHLSRLFEEDGLVVETEANRFAAEFLLPEQILKSIIITDFNSNSLFHIEHRVLIRFIARLYCKWWLPYRSIVRRLKEIDLITDKQYKTLYELNERDPDGEFARICTAICKEDFCKLNSRTNNIGISPKDLEIIIRNFEDDIIDEDKFRSILRLFGKSPEDFGYDLQISAEDLEELKDFFHNQGDNNES